MATPVQIVLSNFATNLVLSTNPRGSSPDGNIYLFQDSDEIQIITAEELAQVDLGSGLEDNPLTNDLGITLQAIYAFERQVRNTNVALRQFLPGVEGRFQDAGAFAFVNGVKLSTANSSTGDDRTKIRGSGWTEFAEDGGIDRIYFAARSLNQIQPTSQPFVQISASLSESDRQAAATVNAGRLGPLDQAFQVLGSTANTPSDASAGDFDFTSRILIAGVRTFGFTQGEVNSQGSGVTRLQAFSAGVGLGENVSPSAAFTLADVFGGSAVAPFTGIDFFREASPQVRSGFNEADGSFTDTIRNSANASLAQIRARLDAIMQQETDQNANTANTGPFLPKRAEPLYTINSAAQLVTRAGIFIENIAASDNQSVILTDDAGNPKTFPFQNEIRVAVSEAWFNDPNAWYTAYFVDGAGNLDFETLTAVIVNDAVGSPVSGTPGDSRAQGGANEREVVFSFDFSGNTQAGLPGGTDKLIIFLAEGDGGAVASFARITINSQAVITASAEGATETNI